MSSVVVLAHRFLKYKKIKMPTKVDSYATNSVMGINDNNQEPWGINKYTDVTDDQEPNDIFTNTIVNLKVIRIGLYFPLVSFHTKWRIQLGSVFVLTLRNWKKGQFAILRDISENVTLVQIMEGVGNVIHAVSIVSYWILGLNYKKALPLIINTLNIIRSASVWEGMLDVFESVFHTVRYINNTGKLNIDDQ